MFNSIQEVVDYIHSNGLDINKRTKKPLGATHFITTFYRSIKGEYEVKDNPFSDDIGFVNSASKRLLDGLATIYQNPKDKAMELIFSVYKWAENEGLDWNIHTCIKKWPAYKQGKLKVEPPVKQLTVDVSFKGIESLEEYVCITDKGTPIKTKAELNALFKAKKIVFDESEHIWKEL